MKKPAPPNPSIARILWTDYTAFYLTLFPIVSWIICLAWIPSWRADGPIIPAWMAPYVLIISLLITLICLVFLALRLVTIWQVFRKGAQVRGRVALVYLRRDRGRVEYTYIYKGAEYQTGVAIHRTKGTQALTAGDPVILLVDPSKPKRAFIRDLYK